MNTPLVSVIISNYNHALYLEERIESVLNQTYQNFELIILDDCSPDNGASKSIIEKYRSNPHISHIIYNDVNSGSLAVKGIGALEHKIVFDYLVRGKFIPPRKVFKSKAAYISRLLRIDYFETGEIRKRVFDTWDKYGYYRFILVIAKKYIVSEDK